MKNISRCFGKLSQMKQQGKNMKIRAIFTLIEKTMSGEKRYFYLWRRTLFKEKQINKCKGLALLFEAA